VVKPDFGEFSAMVNEAAAVADLPLGDFAALQTKT
jgi:hypothetical protein